MTPNPLFNLAAGPKDRSFSALWADNYSQCWQVKELVCADCSLTMYTSFLLSCPSPPYWQLQNVRKRKKKQKKKKSQLLQLKAANDSQHRQVREPVCIDCPLTMYTALLAFSTTNPPTHVCCTLPPALLLFLLAQNHHFAGVQSSHFLIENSPLLSLKNYKSHSAIKVFALPALIVGLSSARREGCSSCTVFRFTVLSL